MFEKIPSLPGAECFAVGAALPSSLIKGKLFASSSTSPLDNSVPCIDHVYIASLKAVSELPVYWGGLFVALN